MKTALKILPLIILLLAGCKKDRQLYEQLGLYHGNTNYFTWYSYGSTGSSTDTNYSDIVYLAIAGDDMFYLTTPHNNNSHLGDSILYFYDRVSNTASPVNKGALLYSTLTFMGDSLYIAAELRANYAGSRLKYAGKKACR